MTECQGCKERDVKIAKLEAELICDCSGGRPGAACLDRCSGLLEVERRACKTEAGIAERDAKITELKVALAEQEKTIAELQAELADAIDEVNL